MAFKAVLFFAAVLLVQNISGQCASRCASAPSCSSGSSSRLSLSSASSCNTVNIPSNGGALIATSTGPIVPSGISVASNLNLDGKLDVNGCLPYLSAVAFEGTYPTSGSSSVSYGCGDGNVGIQNVIGGSSSSLGSLGGSSLSNLGGCGCRA